MEAMPPDDPFLWDVNTVAEYLCSLQRPCTQDPVALASKIRDEGFDGQALLPFDLVCSRAELFDCLGIKLGAHKVSLRQAIINLRSRSAAFRQWRLDLSTEQSEDVPSTFGSQVLQPATVLEKRQQTHQDEAFSPPFRFRHPLNSPIKDVAPIANERLTSLDTMEGRPLKRARVAPVQLTEKPAHLSPLPLATEADVLGRHSCEEVEATQTGLFGNATVVHTFLKEEEDGFTTIFPIRLPAGPRLTAGRAMKHYLIKNSRSEVLLRQGTSMKSTSAVEDEDEIIDFGDLPDSPDEQNLREMEAERIATEKLATEENAVLESERVETLLQEAMDDFKEAWEQSKLPKYALKAHKMWANASRQGTRTMQIIEARRRAKDYEKRIRRLCADIIGLNWAKESDVRRQARSLEQSVVDKLYNQWLADLLEARTEPPKPDSLPKVKTPFVRRQRSSTESEILTSSDEDEFVVPDHDREPVVSVALDPILGPDSIWISDSVSESERIVDDRVHNNDVPVPHRATAPVQIQSPLPGRQQSPMLVDLTQEDNPASPKSRRLSTHDLGTTIKQRSHASESVARNDDARQSSRHEGFENAEQIGAQRPRHWVAKKDRERLIISLLWRLQHARRNAVLRAATSNTSDEVFEMSVKKHLTKPNTESMEQVWEGGPENMPFDMTRLFVCYVRVKNCKQARILNLAPSYKPLMFAQGERWKQFYAFLNRIATIFPDDSQIFRADAIIGFSDADDDADLDCRTTFGKRNKPPKEIVQNKEAVEIREREKRRQEELDARRRKLRADLSTLDLMPRDKSRLIINEAKQDKQSFIYVNEDIGKRIKDHQIEGVRFMWESIVLDKGMRQGCLLAHSMGLGKTMQVITLLVAIQEAAKSSDAAVASQLPEDLKKYKTLVVCPPGLVNNWIDELLRWAPEGILGSIRKIDSDMSDLDRRQTARSWADQDEGVLVIGYQMLQKVVANDEKLDEKLMAAPTFVVADEAHLLKNPDTKTTQVCVRFKTNCRIAMTGSPLANNVEEYYHMINWVAPNYLGSLNEFKHIYATAIQQGLWGDSTCAEKRKAFKMLQVLKDTVAPKINRKTTKSLPKDLLPPKQEFVICVPPTPLQKKLYELYLSTIYGEYEGLYQEKKVPQAQLFSIACVLGLLCNHPRCFRQKMIDARSEGFGEEDTSTYLSESLISVVVKETNNILDLDDPSLSAKSELFLMILDEARQMNDKVLVFSQSIATLNYLENLLQMQKRRVCRLDGSTAINKRHEMTKSFNAGDQEVFLISTNAGGVGLNIPGANRVVIFDFKWNPVNDLQAVGRAYRIGQEKPVFVYRFVVGGTFEEDLQNRAVFKLQLASRVVDKKNPVSWSKRDCSLLHSIKTVRQKSLEEFKGKDQVLDKLIAHKQREKIRYIVSTDTFEEEDPDFDLTPEERRDADGMVKLNLLRRNDPAEYDRQISMMHMQQAYPSGGTPASILDLVPTLPGDLHMQVPASVVDDVRAVRGRTTPSKWMMYHSPTFQHQQLQQASPTQSGAAPMPIMGADTFFGAQPQPQLSAQSSLLAGPPPLATGATTGEEEPAVRPPQENHGKQEFQDEISVRLEALQPGYSLALSESREESARRVATAIQNVRNDSAQWDLLRSFLCHDRFVIAAASGHLTASYLARIGRDELERRVRVLNDLPAHSVREGLVVSGLKTPDPVNLKNLRRSSSHQVTTELGPRANEDIKAMREAADMRRRRTVYFSSTAT